MEEINEVMVEEDINQINNNKTIILILGANSLLLI